MARHCQESETEDCSRVWRKKHVPGQVTGRSAWRRHVEVFMYFNSLLPAMVDSRRTQKASKKSWKTHQMFAHQACLKPSSRLLWEHFPRCEKCVVRTASNLPARHGKGQRADTAKSFLQSFIEAAVTSVMNCHGVSQICHLWKPSNQGQMDAFLDDASSLYASY